MASGEPNWSQLAAMGKLPKGQEGKVPHLAERNKAEEDKKKLEVELAEARKRIQALESGESVTMPATDIAEVKDTPVGDFPVACDVEGCDYKNVATTEGIARNMIRMHNRAHPEKTAIPVPVV